MPLADYQVAQYGDINEDGSVNNTDLAILESYLEGTAGLDGIEYEAAQMYKGVNGGTGNLITAHDLDAMHMYINGIGDIEEKSYTFSRTLYMEAIGGSVDGGTQLQQSTYTNAANQIWIIRKGEDGFYSVSASYKPSLCLTYNDTTNKVAIANDIQADKQRWSIVRINHNMEIALVPKLNPEKTLAVQSSSNLIILASRGALDNLSLIHI